MLSKQWNKVSISFALVLCITLGLNADVSYAASQLRKPTISQQTQFIKSIYPYSYRDWNLKKSSQADRYMLLADMQFESLIPLKPIHLNYASKENFAYLPYSIKSVDDWTQRLFNFKTKMNHLRSKDGLLISYKSPKYRYLISPERGGGVYKMSHQVSQYKKISTKRVYVQFQSYSYSAIFSKHPNMNTDFLRKPRSTWTTIQKSEAQLDKKGYAILESSGDKDYPWRVILLSFDQSSLSDKEISKYK